MNNHCDTTGLSTSYAYLKGCRCDKCVADSRERANRSYHRRKQHDYHPTQYVDAEKARKTLRTLMDKHRYTTTDIVMNTGVSYPTLRKILYGIHGKPIKRVLKNNYDPIHAMLEKQNTTQGKA